ncbi:Eae-like protein [Kosakonia cowanii]|uniref:Eae-like protein n=1 Tax=Kosakonia cowanii TaxID=208223 RepID=UPI002DDCB3FD|nr:Eae-like protein [Kosakonia cowanii]WRY60931.1 Eae-like protein [Kosakonia cowanii]
MNKPTIEELEAQVKQLAVERDAVVAENVGMDSFVESMLAIAWQGGSADGSDIQELALKCDLIRQEVYCADKHENLVDDPGNFEDGDALYFRVQTPATDAILASLRAEARKQGAVFAANRMLAAWDAGFVEDTPEDAADIARAILMSTEFMDEAPDGDFDRSFADEMLEAIAAQLRSKSEVQHE